jgi:L-alanine-DL-glutamate epimerase-like enolase superfamily enzyme
MQFFEAMKIVSIETKRIKLELYNELKIAFAILKNIENVVVKITTDEGITGYGEAAPFAPVTGETADSVISVLALFTPALLGTNPLEIELIHTKMNKTAYGNPSAKCAIDMACYDIAGKAAQKPVYQLLGGTNKAVQNDVTIGISTPEKMAEEALFLTKEKGYRIIKVKAGINPDFDILALSRIRKAVGDTIRIRVDANQGYTLKTAKTVIQKMTLLNIEAIEQCLPYWDIESHAVLRNNSGGIAIVLDESIHDVHDAERACKTGAADALNIKLMKSGGIYQGLKINETAERNNVKCMAGCMLETRLALTASLSLAAACTNITGVDCDSLLFYDDSKTGIRGGFTVSGDTFVLTDNYGFGIEVDL